jgi:uncharacterized protein YqjF (DUF2071 family)
MTAATSSTTMDARLAERCVPAQSVVMYQRWEELLFLHWTLAPEVVAKDLPPGLRVDTFDGKAWIGVVPFSMRGVRPRFLPPVKGLSSFPELNLRTYVVDKQGRPGVWFYSLDTPKRLPNWIARTFFFLNYRLARMQVQSSAERCEYRSELWMGTDWDALQKYQWQRNGAAEYAEPGSLEFFLVERYRLFAYNRRRDRLLTGRVHHQPYPIQPVQLIDYSKRLFELNGLATPEGAPFSALASAGVDVRVFPIERVFN